MKRKSDYTLHLYGTLGNACNDKEILKHFLINGMTGLVLPFTKDTSKEEIPDWFCLLRSVFETLKIIPDLIIDDPQFSDHYSYYKNRWFTGVFARQISRGNSIRSIKELLLPFGRGKVSLFAVIENQEDISALPMVLPYCDAVILDRTALFHHHSLCSVPALEQEAIQICRRTNIPFLLSGELFSSMLTQSKPSLAEVNDIYHGVFQGTSGFLLTDATASGKYPKEAVEYLSKISFEALRQRKNARFM